MRIEEFDYELPPGQIAQQPVEPRDASRLLVLHRKGGFLEHRHFYDLPRYLHPGDVLVVNETKVIPARLWGYRAGTGAKIEVLLLTRQEGDTWETLVRPGRRVPVGAELIFGGGELQARVKGVTPAGGRIMEFSYQEGPWEALLERLGEMPLPPYIKEKPADPGRYQTVYAREEGSAAAPTAGLHFTPRLLKELREQGIEIASILLHVGLGTFRPVKVENIQEHVMHAEYYAVTPAAAATINAARARGHRVVAVGTTVVRTLETVATADGVIHAGSGWTDIFIYPGYRFKAIDCLITNFHLPRSTLLMLVSAFAGREKILDAYRVAVREGYRFYSFGDAMLIL
ncbi:S-adenosylmethionine:tRNA ribosyltransferase-isomerase [Moorella thermoacetica]|uniref:S-adenosylmethionine:tRNA ribosyltransferase-isomerase n=1 Tax=Neomoorella thermoacetica TaxID=1525 RepID=A0AAC9MV18_NEOTH|nr:tRNA preQ1(34) S-adenosylmethionine ribosyltransferase-isomerase QueA [Moorella thermoacetica]AOQ24420.1 S-adenosylmethionine:tRNA ribosyltransferase-isomerase [Moorella thermoacetica]TYL11072.1 S-adenosylmethionine:tRNA ribosyltransferase-isomerase [Moorella thermoacetica]